MQEQCGLLDTPLSGICLCSRKCFLKIISMEQKGEFLRRLTQGTTKVPVPHWPPVCHWSPQCRGWSGCLCPPCRTRGSAAPPRAPRPSTRLSSGARTGTRRSGRRPCSAPRSRGQAGLDTQTHLVTTTLTQLCSLSTATDTPGALGVTVTLWQRSIVMPWCF